MPHTTGKRYAVVSCHVERPLDDRAWDRFALLHERMPGGFRIAALFRPPDRSAGEDESPWVERAREAAERGPLGHHTHWTAFDHARPLPGGDAAERVLADGARLRELGVAPTIFCGGGWYTDADVAEACAELGYVDCTPRAKRPVYLRAGEPWASLQAPARIPLLSGKTLRAIPTTHSLGDLARALPRPWSLPQVVHVYFHDTDLLSRRRRSLVSTLLPLLAAVVRRSDLDTLSGSVVEDAPEMAWIDVARI
jgi:hypothetical protein